MCPVKPGRFGHMLGGMHMQMKIIKMKMKIIKKAHRVYMPLQTSFTHAFILAYICTFS